MILRDGHALRELTGNIDYTSSEKRADPGKTSTETARVRARETDHLLLDVNDPRFVLKLFTGDGNVIIMGSPLYPARLLITRNPPEITLTFSVTTP
jgi:hypothetical protein